MEYSTVALAVAGVIGCAGLAAYQLSGTCKSARSRKPENTGDFGNNKKGNKKQQNSPTANDTKAQQQQQQPKAKKQQQQQQPKQEQPKQASAAPKQQAQSPKSTPAPAPVAQPDVDDEVKQAPKDKKQKNKQQKEDGELAALQKQLTAAIAAGDMALVKTIADKMVEVKKNATAAANASNASAAPESAEIVVTPDVVEAQKKELEAILASEGHWTTVSNKSKEKAAQRKAEERERKAREQAEAAAKAESAKGDKKEEEKKEPKKEKKTIEVTIDPTKRSKLIGPDASVIKRIGEMFPEVRLDIPKKDAPKQNTVKITGEANDIEAVKRIVIDLTTRGFSKTLDPELRDSHINIPEDKVALVFGKGGATISAIQRETKTNITKQEQSPGQARSPEPQVTLIIVGDKDGVESAKKAIRQTIADGYCKLVHPDWITLKVDFPKAHRSKLIGANGGRIKKLKDLYKCDFKFPETDDEFVNIIGPAGDLMQKAQAAIVELREHFSRPRESNVLDGFDEEDIEEVAADKW